MKHYHKKIQIKKNQFKSEHFFQPGKGPPLAFEISKIIHTHIIYCCHHNYLSITFMRIFSLFPR